MAWISVNGRPVKPIVGLCLKQNKTNKQKIQPNKSQAWWCILAVLNWAGKDRQAPGAHCPACLICLASSRLVKRQTEPEEEHSSVSSGPHMCVHTGTPAHRCTHTKEQGCKVTRPVIRMVRNHLHRQVSKPSPTEPPPSWDQLQHEPQREKTRFHTYVLFSFLCV